MRALSLCIVIAAILAVVVTATLIIIACAMSETSNAAVFTTFYKEHEPVPEVARADTEGSSVRF